MEAPVGMSTVTVIRRKISTNTTCRRAEKKKQLPLPPSVAERSRNEALHGVYNDYFVHVEVSGRKSSVRRVHITRYVGGEATETDESGQSDSGGDGEKNNRSDARAAGEKTRIGRRARSVMVSPRPAPPFSTRVPVTSARTHGVVGSSRRQP